MATMKKMARMKMAIDTPIPDAAEREMALDPRASFIVSAPAGSGKTELLMHRFLKLLAVVDRPEEIVAMTFTRKAAGEMQGRIIEALTSAVRGEEAASPYEMSRRNLARIVLERAAEKGWDILDNPGRLKVQTIDSFCASIVRQMPVLSRMGALASISDSPSELYLEAARRTVEAAEDDGTEADAVRLALRNLDNSTANLTDRLAEMLEKRDQWLRHLSGPDAELRGRLEEPLRKAVEAGIKGVVDLVAFPTFLASRLIAAVRYAATNITDKDPSLASLVDASELPSASADDFGRWQAIRKLLLTDDDKWRIKVDKRNGFPADKAGKERKTDFLELVAALSEQDGLLGRLAALKQLPAPAYTDEEWRTLSALIHLLPSAVKRLEEVFMERREVDFQSVALSAVEALGPDDAPTDLMLSLDWSIRHILVDEYQDTSYAQLALLASLVRGWERGDGRTLFVVGDPMQSIFLFRDSDVGLFLDAKRNGIGNVNLIPIDLRSNFRSDAGIVDWVNDAFGRAMPSKDDAVVGAIRYSKSSAVIPGGSPPEIASFAGRTDATEADRIVSLIESIPKDESVAVLCRSRSHAAGIVSALKKGGVPFRAQDFDQLRHTPVVQDLYALARALSHPYDRIAWLAVLRSPLCGMKLDDLLRLCAGASKSAVSSLLNDDERLRGLSDDGRDRALHIREFLSKALSLVGRVGFRGLVEGLWIELGGPATARTDAGMKDAEAFFRVIESVSTAGGLDATKDVEARLKALYAAHAAPDAHIDIMTIHKAKGLEFDNVILPGLGRRPRPEGKKLLLWLEREDALLLAPMEKKDASESSGVYDYLRRMQNTKADLEQARLFYVACTRARKRLFLFGHVGINLREEGVESKIDKKSFFALIRDLLPEPEATGPSETTQEARAVQPLLRRLPCPFTLPLAVPAVASVTAPDVESNDLEPVYDWAGARIRHVGSVVHRCLAVISREGSDKWDDARVKAGKNRALAHLKSLGLNAADASASADDCIAAIARTLKDARGRWILESHPESAAEWPITSVIDNRLVKSVIDRTFVADGVRWIIDYKTGAHEGGGLDEFIKNEKERYAPQLERYAVALKALGETREIRKGLYYPAHSAWVEW
ncbi:MAG: UvrD-helicase domain-containing protein [Deltaproteobacteria bacterium]|nr:UvrD-helicase domain-containing protein [Deltaproteobacteria bacterium]